MKKLLIKIISSLIIYLNCLNPVYADNQWKMVQKDLKSYKHHSKDYFLKDLLFYKEVIFFRSSLKDLKLKVIRASDYGQKRLKIKDLTMKSGATFGINANFFDEFDNPLGLIISNGNQLNKMHSTGSVLTGVFFLKNNFPQIVHRKNFNNISVEEAIQSGPRLLYNYKRINGLRNRERISRRSGICTFANYDIAFFISDRLGGISLERLQNALIDVGCKDAINLDGGPSSQIFYKGTDNINEISISSKIPIPVMIGLF